MDYLGLPFDEKSEYTSQPTLLPRFRPSDLDQELVMDIEGFLADYPDDGRYRASLVLMPDGFLSPDVHSSLDERGWRQFLLAREARIVSLQERYRAHMLSSGFSVPGSEWIWFVVNPSGDLLNKGWHAAHRGDPDFAFMRLNTDFGTEVCYGTYAWEHGDEDLYHPHQIDQIPHMFHHPRTNLRMASVLPWVPAVFALGDMHRKTDRAKGMQPRIALSCGVVPIEGFSGQSLGQFPFHPELAPLLRLP